MHSDGRRAGGRCVWVDLSSAPDPLFFRPIVARLSALGLRVWITARQYGETTTIAEQCNLAFETVGRHGGRSLAGKTTAVWRRAASLAEIARRERPDVAVSLNSYAQALAARRRGIPLVTVMDYEHQPANHLAFRLARRVVVPEGFDPVSLRRQGARADRVVFHPGLKEHVTLVDFRPDRHFGRQLEELGVASTDLLVTMRPPPTHSAYHRFDDGFFDQVLRHVSRQPGVKVVLLPRYRSEIEQKGWHAMAGVIVPTRVMDGLNLICSSDLVISAGGSMNREAVVLGTPACTVFRGRVGGVDRKLIAEGHLLRVSNAGELEALRVSKKVRSGRPPVGPGALDTVVATVVEAGRLQ